MNHRHYTGGTTVDMSGDNYAKFSFAAGMGFSTDGSVSGRASYCDLVSKRGISSSGNWNTGSININLSHSHSWGDWSSTPRYWGNEGVERLSTASAYGNSQGAADAHNNMPPYIVKYCWERVS